MKHKDGGGFNCFIVQVMDKLGVCRGSLHLHYCRRYFFLPDLGGRIERLVNGSWARGIVNGFEAAVMSWEL